MTISRRTFTTGIENLFDLDGTNPNPAALAVLREDFELTDAQIRNLGFSYLFPETERNAPKKFTVHVREVWEGDITVIAADEEEALDKVYSADIYSTTEDLAMIDWDADATEETE